MVNHPGKSVSAPFPEANPDDSRKYVKNKRDLQGFLSRGAGFNPTIAGIIGVSVMVFHSSLCERGPELPGAVYQRFERQ